MTINFVSEFGVMFIVTILESVEFDVSILNMFSTVVGYSVVVTTPPPLLLTLYDIWDVVLAVSVLLYESLHAI